MSNHIDTTGTATTLEVYVDPFPGRNADDAEWSNCGRCAGQGYLAGYEAISNGICFECMGGKGHMSTVKTLRSRESGRVSRRNKSTREWVAKAEAHNTRMAAAEAKHPILAGWFNAMDTDQFLSDLWVKAFDYDLSDKQVDAAAASMTRTHDRDAARKAEKDAKLPAPEGKITVTGEIVAVKYVENNFSYNSTGTWKMLMKAEGSFTVWASITTKMWDLLRATREDENWNPSPEDFKGRTVTFTATLEPARDDATHAFAKRPTKPVLV